MKWCRFTANGSTSYGIIEGETVHAVSGSPFGEHAKTGVSHDLGSVQLEVPVIPPTFYAAGINYPEHVTWAAHMRGQEPDLPKRADVGYRAINALVPHGHDIVVPADATEQLQYEGELVVVIGKTCRNVSENEALDYVLGYTIGNDVSERTWQRNDRTMWRAKNTDTFKPMGPWIVTDLNPDDLHVIIRGKRRCRGRIRRGRCPLRSAPLHQRDEQIPDPRPRRCAVDGHRRGHGEHEGRGCLRHRNQRHRHP